MIKAIIVEDEEPNIHLLSGYLKKDFPEVEVLAVCKTVMESVEKINLLKPDLVFLDIWLGEKEQGGFEVLEHTKNVEYEVIFTTAHAEYAIKAIKLSALDYLLRPFESKDVGEALKRYKEGQLKGSEQKVKSFLYNKNQQDISLHRVAISSNDGMMFIPVSEIIMCSADNNCTNFHLTKKFADQIHNTNKKLLATKTLKHFQEVLQEHYFFRTHKSYLVNMRHVIKYKKGSDGDKGGEGGIVFLSENLEADVSRDKKDGFNQSLDDLGMK